MIARAFRQLWISRSRYLLTYLAIVMSVGFVNATLMLTDTVGSGDRAVVEAGEAGIDAVIDAVPGTSPGGFSGPAEMLATSLGIPTDVATTAAGAPGVVSAEAVWSSTASLLDDDGSIVGQTRGPFNEVETWITDPETARWQILEGTAPTQAGEMVLDAGTARAFGVRLGDRYRLATDRSTATFTVVGIAGYGTAEGRPSRTTVLVDASEPALVGDGRIATQVVVRAAEGTSEQELVADLEEHLAAAGHDVRVRSGVEATADAVDRIAVETSILARLLTVFTLVAALTGMLIITNTFAITMVQRRRELALMRAIGTTRAEVVRSVLFEAAALAVTATATGLLLGRVVVRVIQELFGRAGVDAFSGAVVVTPTTMGITVIIGVLITVVAALRAAVSGARVPPVAALRDAAVDDRATTNSWRRGVGPLLVVAGVALAMAGMRGSRSLLLLVGSLLGVLGVYLTGPLLASWAARAAAPVLASVAGATGRLAARNAARAPRRVSAAAAGLMIGVAVVTFFSVIGASVKSLQVGPISAVRADHAITPLGAPAGKVPADVSQGVQAIPGVEDWATIHSTVGLLVDPTAHPDAPPTVIPVGMIEAGDLAATYDLAVHGTEPADPTDPGGLPDPGDLAPGELLVASSELDVHPLGSEVTIRGSAGTLTGTVVGSFDTALPGFVSPQVLADRDTYQATFDDPGAVAIFVATDGRASTLQAIEEVTNGSGRFQTAEEYARASTSPVDTILDLISALLGMAVVIALVGLANTMALSLRERAAEIGVARAIGTTRYQVVTSVLLEASVTAVLGVVLGLVVGLGVTFPTVAMLEVDALAAPVIPVGRLAMVAVLATGAGVMAAIAPALTVARRSPLEAIAGVE